MGLSLLRTGMRPPPSPTHTALTSCFQTNSVPVASWPAAAPWAAYENNIPHQDTLGIISILNNVYGNGGYKLSFTGMPALFTASLKL